MGSITSWTRLETRCRDADMARTVGARLFDPLWLLTRQWQTGEFRGEDAGSPVVARVRANTATLSRVHLGALPANTRLLGAPYDPAAMPLETLVERQRVRPAAGDAAAKLRLVVEAGLHFLRLLERQPTSKPYRAAYTAHYALAADGAEALDAASAAWLRSMAGRVPDARRLETALRTKLAPDPALAVAAADRAEVEAAARQWLDWIDALFSEPGQGRVDGGGWLSDRLEYAVAVGTRLSASPQDERTLVADEITEGELDWSDFDVDAEVDIGAFADRCFESVVQTAVPAPITFRGAPAARFWEFENAQIDYGLMPVGAGDVAQLLAIEYASSWGNDWFVVPLDLRVGSLTAVTSLVVTDTFGMRQLLRPLGDPALKPPNWSMFQLARHRRAGAEAPRGVEPNLFLLAPTLPRSLQGAPLEEVLFLRDEMANMAWAIEHAIESPLETALRRDGPAAEAAAEDADAQAPPLRYRLASTVPAHWIPLLPVQLPQPDGTRQQRLRRGAVLLPDGSRQVRHALGRVLNHDPRLLLHDEEVPREGLRVARHMQLARWIDGRTLCWMAQRTQVGRGEGSSGLRFDQVEERDAPRP